MKYIIPIGWVIGGVIAFFVLLAVCAGNEQEPEHCVGWHRLYGSHQVVYPDGQVSQPFTFKVARDYQKLFGGTVVKAYRRY